MSYTLLGGSTLERLSQADLARTAPHPQEARPRLPTLCPHLWQSSLCLATAGARLLGWSRLLRSSTMNTPRRHLGAGAELASRAGHQSGDTPSLCSST